jgi:hypothetical protein
MFTMATSESKALRDMREAAVGFGKKTKGGQGDELKYAIAYQALVTLGLRPQLRKKYRPK